VRRRDFTIGLLAAAAARLAWAQAATKQHRIAIVLAGGTVARISETSSDPVSRRFFQAFFAELRRLGDVEGQNLMIERYTGEGRPASHADLAREVVSRNPEVIVASTGPVALAVRAATATIPIVFSVVEAVRLGLVTDLAHPGGNLTGVSLFDAEFVAKRLQLLKEAVPSASRIAFLNMRKTWEGAYGQAFQPAYQEASRRLQIELVPMPLEESTPSEYLRVFAEIAKDPPDAILVSDIGDLIPYRQLIVELIEKSRLPAMYGLRDYVEAGGLMAYEADFGETGRRMADDVHEILNGASPGDIPIYQSTRFALVINLKAAKTLGLTMPPALLARADEVIE
jgi:putative tryptophan/tyrosine transport system substrate-binding protein